MEAKEVYMTTQQVEDLRAKVNAIEGLDEIRAARKAWVNYHEAKTRFERGEIDYEDVPKYDPKLLGELEKKYPRAAAFLEAERWISSTNPVKIRLGSRAMEKILNGEEPDAVLHYMSIGLDAFNLAQEG